MARLAAQPHCQRLEAVDDVHGLRCALVALHCAMTAAALSVSNLSTSQSSQAFFCSRLAAVLLGCQGPVLMCLYLCMFLCFLSLV